MGKKMLLTSDGLTSPNLGRRFLELVDKDSADIKVLFVPTASEAKEEKDYLERKAAYFKLCEDILTNLGIKKENLSWLDINPVKSASTVVGAVSRLQLGQFNRVNNIAGAGNLNAYDAMFVCGGNTFFLLHEVRRIGFDEKIVDFVNSGKVYVGESAGSVIAGPDISIAGPFDPNDVGIKNTTGLKMTDKIICPHYDKKKNIIDEFEKKCHFKVVRLKDGQAWEETDATLKIIE